MTEEDLANTYITNAILRATKSSIPRGSVKQYNPFWNDELQKSVQMRQEARKEYEKDSNQVNIAKYNSLSAESNLLSNEIKKRTWTD